MWEFIKHSVLADHQILALGALFTAISIYYALRSFILFLKSKK